MIPKNKLTGSFDGSQEETQLFFSSSDKLKCVSFRRPLWPPWHLLTNTLTYFLISALWVFLQQRKFGDFISMPLISNRRWVIFYYVKSIKLTTIVLHLKSWRMGARWLQAKTIPGALLQNIHGHNQPNTLLILFEQNTWIQIVPCNVRQASCTKHSSLSLSQGFESWSSVVGYTESLPNRSRTIKCFEKTIQNIKLNGKTTWDSQKCVIRATICAEFFIFVTEYFVFSFSLQQNHGDGTKQNIWQRQRILHKFLHLHQKCTNYFVLRRI